MPKSKHHLFCKIKIHLPLEDCSQSPIWKEAAVTCAAPCCFTEGHKRGLTSVSQRSDTFGKKLNLDYLKVVQLPHQPVHWGSRPQHWSVNFNWGDKRMENFGINGISWLISVSVGWIFQFWFLFPCFCWVTGTERFPNDNSTSNILAAAITLHPSHLIRSIWWDQISVCSRSLPVLRLSILYLCLNEYLILGILAKCAKYTKEKMKMR